MVFPGSNPTTSRRRFLQGLAGGGLSGVGGCMRLQRPQETVRLSYLDVSGMRSKESFQQIIDQLRDRFNTGIELDFVEVPYENMQQKLLTQVGSGDAPDIAAIDQIWLGSIIDSGNLMPLTDITDVVDFDDYLEPFRRPVVHEGDVYAVPITTDVRGMYWNKQQFEAAGLDPDRPPRTWSDLYETAEQLHEPPDVFAAVYFVVAGRWTVNLFSLGGSILDDTQTSPRFHESPGIEAARFVDDLYNHRDISPPTPPYRNGAQVAREFLQGQYSINLIEGSWLDYFWTNLGHEHAEMERRFGFAPTPCPEDASPTTMSGGFVWAGFDSTEYPDIVKAFLELAAGRDFKRQLAIDTKAIPTRASLLDDEAIWDQILYSDTVKSMLEVTKTRPVRNWSTVEESLDSSLQEVAFDRAAPRDALTAAAEEVSEKLST